jgi:hypothetical protein
VSLAAVKEWIAEAKAIIMFIVYVIIVSLGFALAALYFFDYPGYLKLKAKVFGATEEVKEAKEKLKELKK